MAQPGRRGVHRQGLRLRERHLRQAGPDHASEVLEQLRAADLPNEIILELFGVPPSSFLQEVDCCERLFQLGNTRLSCFISPMGPFIDPGSRGFPGG